jgi:hypothetical protein
MPLKEDYRARLNRLKAIDGTRIDTDWAIMKST